MGTQTEVCIGLLTMDGGQSWQTKLAHYPPFRHQVPALLQCAACATISGALDHTTRRGSSIFPAHADKLLPCQGEDLCRSAHN